MGPGAGAVGGGPMGWNWRAVWVGVLVSALWLGEGLGGSIECVQISFHRAFCVVEPICIQGTMVRIPNDVPMRCLKHDGEPYPGRCNKLFDSVLSVYKSTEMVSGLELHSDEAVRSYIRPAALIFPALKWMHNIYHYGRAINYVLEVERLLGKFVQHPPKDVFFFDPVMSWQRQSWNEGLTSMLSRFFPLNLIDAAQAGQQDICFEQGVLLSKDEGPIFTNLTRPFISWREMQTNSHIPSVPLGSLRFREIVDKGLHHAERFGKRDKYIDIPVPPAVMVMNARTKRAARRNMAEADNERLNNIMAKAASTYGLEQRTYSFEDKTFLQQVEMMSDVGFAIGLHGANMMNGIFMPPLGSMIEIFPRFYRPFTYLAGGNGGLQYNFVESDDSTVEACDGKLLPCQEYLRQRTIRLSETKWTELENRIMGAASYIDTLRKEGPVVRLRLVGDTYYLTSATRRKIVQAWKEKGLFDDKEARRLNLVLGG